MVKNTILSLLLALCCASVAMAQEPAGTTLTSLDQSTDTVYMLECYGPVFNENVYSVGIVANAGNSELAPYYISSNCGGTITQQYSALAYALLRHNIDKRERFSWGAGLAAWAGYASSAGYQRHVGDGQFEVQKQHPARAWIQEAYLSAKYRGIFAVAGQAYKSSPIVDGLLSSGDLVWSNNSRPPVGLRAGFIDFQNIPFTKGWLQIQGEFGYFRELDDKWLENHYNYYNHFITTGRWLDYYENGHVTRTVKMDADLKAFWRTFIAGSGGNSAGDSFVEGNHLGTWDIALQYYLSNYQHLRAYTQWLWEDGSGIGKMNGFDGLWGIEFRQNGSYLVSGAVIEYIDFTNQSGPIHWTPNDHPSTAITSHSSGADDYYNNYIYNGYQSRGMSIGSLPCSHRGLVHQRVALSPAGLLPQGVGHAHHPPRGQRRRLLDGLERQLRLLLAAWLQGRWPVGGRHRGYRPRQALRQQLGSPVGHLL